MYCKITEAHEARIPIFDVLECGHFFILKMNGYRDIYFQKSKESSTVKAGVEDFGIWCKEFPFRTQGEAKELAGNDWNDRDGMDEYIPEALMMKSYDIEVEFAYKGVRDSANAKIKAFLDYLTGRDGTGADLKIYDAYTRIGRQHVRYKNVDDDFTVRNDSEGDVMIFIVTFQVNDPVTDIVLSK